MNEHDHDFGNDFLAWHGWGSPVGISILLVGLGAFLVLLGEAVAVPLSLFR